MLIMDSWNNDLINDRPTVCKSSHLQSPSDLYREAILALEQAIIHINSSNVEHSFAQFCLEKAFSVTKALHSEMSNPDRQDELQEVLKTVDLVNKKLKLVLTTSDTVAHNEKSTSYDLETFKKPSVSFNEVIGLKEAKKSLNEAVIMPLLYPQLFCGKRKPWTRILFYGPPGTGKSRLANAVANEIDSSFYSISSSDVLSSFFGQSEKMIKELFKQAQSGRGRSVIFIDEIDSLCRRRTDKEEEGVRRIKTELLTNMDGLDECNSLFILCATNCPWEIDPAFLRRFQKRVYIPLPCLKSRIEILKLHSGEDCDLSAEEWNRLGEKTEGYSGSDLAVLVNAALFQPVRELQYTTSWRCDCNGKYRPCVSDVPADVTCDFHDLEPSTVLTRSVRLADFTVCLLVNKATVSREDLNRFEEFTNRFGVIGS